jgi:CheY-like chemotaxis protein
MGLFTVWESLKELGGTLRVTSAPGQGSTFSIYFPQVRDNSESLAQQRQETSTLVAPTILVLGVEEVVRTLVCRILNREGYHVLEACHASEAEHLGRDSAAAVQLLILDSQVQAAGDIVPLLRDRCPHLKVLHLVNDLVGERIHEGTDLATAVLSKPFLPHVLIDKVRGLLNCDQRSVASRP